MAADDAKPAASGLLETEGASERSSISHETGLRRIDGGWLLAAGGTPGRASPVDPLS